jgi:hypothetical protein
MMKGVVFWVAVQRPAAISSRPVVSPSLPKIRMSSRPRASAALAAPMEM